MSEYVPIGDLPHMNEALGAVAAKTRRFWRGTLLASWPKRMGAAAVNYIAPAWAAYMLGAPIFGQNWLGSDTWWALSFVLAMFASGVNPWRIDVGRSLFGTTLVRTVLDATGKPGFARVGYVWRIVRFLCHPLDFTLGLPIGLVLVAVRKDHRSIADMIAGTVVIDTPMRKLDQNSIGLPERFPGLYRRDRGQAVS